MLFCPVARPKSGVFSLFKFKEKEKEENVRFRDILKFEVPARNKMFAARIVSREPGSWFQWVIIDKGRADGLSIDVPVLVIKDNRLCVVGRVGELFDHSSKVVLLTNALFAMPSMAASTNEDGLLEGQYGPLMRINYLPAKKPLTVGELILTSPLSSIMPERAVVGKVKKMLVTEDETFASAIVEPQVNLGDLREVIILVPERDRYWGKRQAQNTNK